VAVLLNQNTISGVGERENVDPIWILENVVWLYSAARREFAGVDAKREKAIMDLMSRFEQLPHVLDGSLAARRTSVRRPLPARRIVMHWRCCTRRATVGNARVERLVIHAFREVG
jgi:hypothetical protein